MATVAAGAPPPPPPPPASLPLQTRRGGFKRVAAASPLPSIPSSGAERPDTRVSKPHESEIQRRLICVRSVAESEAISAQRDTKASHCIVCGPVAAGDPAPPRHSPGTAPLPPQTGYPLAMSTAPGRASSLSAKGRRIVAIEIFHSQCKVVALVIT